MKTEFYPISNPRTPGGGFKHPDLICGKCGCVTSAYIELSVVDNGCDVFHGIILCKGCLDKGIQTINKDILK